MTKEKVLSQDIAKGSQSVTLLQLVQLGDHRLKVDIKSDSYRDQSHAMISRWDGGRWQEVWSIHTGSMSTKEKLCYQREPATLAAFIEDRNTLMKHARFVLGEL